MKCKQVQDNISPYIDNQLTAGEKIIFESHIKECKNCYGEYLSLLDMVNSINSLGERPLPPGFKEELRSKLEAERKRRKQHKGTGKSFKTWASIVGVLLLGIFITISIFGAGFSPDKINDRFAGLSMHSLRGREGSHKARQKNLNSDETMEQEAIEESSESFNLQQNDHDKIIYSGDITLQVQDADKTLESIGQYAQGIGGFVEHSSIHNPDEKIPKENKESIKGGYITVRVPVDRFDEAIEHIGDMGNVKAKQRSGENITTQYRDMEIEVQSLKIQEERLLELLAKAAKVQDIVEIEKELNRVRTEINQRETMLNNWDHMADYSSIGIDLVEEKVPSTNIVGHPFQDLGRKVQKGFIQSLNYIIIGLVHMVVFLFQVLPFVILIGIAYAIYKKWNKKGK